MQLFTSETVIYICINYKTVRIKAYKILSIAVVLYICGFWQYYTTATWNTVNEALTRLRKAPWAQKKEPATGLTNLQERGCFGGLSVTFSNQRV
jgi:hypothetical protein